jgi:hypothetical protein
LLLLFSGSDQAVGDLVTSEMVAEEVVRTLVGSIGLVASVPVTTALAAVVAAHEKNGEPPGAAGGRAAGPASGLPGQAVNTGARRGRRRKHRHAAAH